MNPRLRFPIFACLAGLLLCVSCRTLPEQAAPPAVTRIALVSDVHVTEGTNEAARLHPLRLARVIEAVKAADVDLILIAGDLTEHGAAWEFAEFKRRIKEFGRPVLFVPGNHDLGNKKMPGRKSSGSEISFGRLRNFELEFGRSFWVREAAGVRVIGLNSGLYGSHLPAEGTMWRMAEAALEKTNTLPTLVLQHHPPFLKTVNEAGGDYFNMEPYPRMRLLALAQQGRARALLSGHIHRGLTNRYEGVLLYSTPPVAFGLPKDKQAEGWTLVTVSRKEVKAEFQPIPKIRLPGKG